MQRVANPAKQTGWGFAWGVAVGCSLTLIALMSGAHVLDATQPANPILLWLKVNLGYSLGLFVLVATVYAIQLKRLRSMLHQTPPPNAQDIIALDQMLDVWTQVFIGIGVIWTAVGMRSALQSALGDPSDTLTANADDVLRRLVDGGILLALSTTIVGAVGGYLMRLIKTVITGSMLQHFYEASQSKEIRALLAATERIEAHVAQSGRAQIVPRVAPASGASQ